MAWLSTMGEGLIAFGVIHLPWRSVIDVVGIEHVELTVDDGDAFGKCSAQVLNCF
jgi:hypothetical protein